MQSAVRAECNHTLEYAIERANVLGQPVLAVFGLMDEYPEANLRHYAFLVEGLQDAQRALARRGILMVVRRGQPVDLVLEFGREASLVVCDGGYLRHQREWRLRLAQESGRAVVRVESEIVVPVELASDKPEVAAFSFRRKVRNHWDRFLAEVRPTPVQHSSVGMQVNGLDLSDLGAVLGDMDIDRSVRPVDAMYQGGTTRGKALLDDFLKNRYGGYAEGRGQPSEDRVNHMSKYLHYGHISPVYLARTIRGSGADQEDVDSYLDELLVRRELDFNWVWYVPNYDTHESLPEWAKRTLAEHAGDERPYVYGLEELEVAGTHDPYWNAAMREMRYTGYMHNHLRMYWGKQILEWSPSPEEGHRRTLYLNNKYLIDGWDPNSYANVA